MQDSKSLHNSTFTLAKKREAYCDFLEHLFFLVRISFQKPNWVYEKNPANSCTILFSSDLFKVTNPFLAHSTGTIRHEIGTGVEGQHE